MDRLKELAAEFAVGTLASAEHAEFHALLKSAPPDAQAEVSRILDTAAVIALALPRKTPSPSLKEKLLAQIHLPKATPELFQFVRSGDNSGWTALSVAGAFVKLLTLQKEKGYAVVLGRLDPGTSYPPHHHIGPEQIYILEGDLHIGDVALHAGDFHAAAAGSDHGVNYSESGCTILAIVSTEDLLALMPG
jgi:anti-sigma factor ChrR (cupin superfamily)